MEICIHRGSKQIGGSCVEFRHEGSRILVDLGLPLDAEGENEKDLPSTAGLDGNDPSLLGVLISHPHLDHFGLLSHISPNIPVGMGKAARKILQAASQFLPDKFINPSAGWSFESEKPFKIGPFIITPFLTDHSAYDAYSLIIEAGGKKVFYSGDFRAHGRKADLFLRLLNKSVNNVNAMLLEGSSLGRIGVSEHFKTETQIEDELVYSFRKTEGLALVHCSSQNIDRVVSIFRACKRTGRKLVIDLYTAEILKATGNKNIPQSYWNELALFVPHHQRIFVKENEMFQTLKGHSRNRIFAEKLESAPDKFVVLFRPLHIADLKRHSVVLENASYIYSQWNGYWENGNYAKVADFLQEYGIEKKSIHTSGHASPANLKLLVESIKPEKVVPIHSFAPEKYSELFSNVEMHKDGEWWSA